MASQNPPTQVGIVNQENWQDILRDNYLVLARIKTEHFVDELYHKCVINLDDKEEVASHRTHRRRATFLLDLLLCKGFTNFIVFLGILEIEYPDAFREVTKKDPVTRPGRQRGDRSTLMMEVMPAMLNKLHNEMQQNESLTGTLRHVEQSIEILKEEKKELEIEVERYRIELRDLPELREKSELLSKEYEELKKENEECINRCSEYIREKENAERRFRELKIKTHDLGREVEVTKLEIKNEKRLTRKWASMCQHLEKDLPVDHEIEILRESERELSEHNQTLACEVWDMRNSRDYAEEELRKALNNVKKCQEALANSEENRENLEQRCEDTRVQVDRLRKEKDNAIKSQQVYFEMYHNTSTERDRLSFQLRTLESQYDSAKKQLDKLKQDMRSSLNSEKTNLSSSINQWIDRLDGPSAYGSGSSSESNTSGGVTGDRRVGGAVSDDLAKHRRLLAQYDMVFPVSASSGGLCLVNGKDTGSEDHLSLGSEDGPHQDFYVRCEQDSSDISEGQLPYTAGDVLLITNSYYDKKRDLWLAERVDRETGVRLLPAGQHQGVIKATNSKDDKPVERKKNVSPDTSEKTSTISRVGAIRKGRSQVCLFTTVTCYKVLYQRPVVILGPVPMKKIVTAMVSSNTDKFESWVNNKLNEVEPHLVSLQEKTSHVILPPCCLKLCYDAKIYPICIYLNVQVKDNNSDYLTSVFGAEEEMEQHLCVNNLNELATSGIIYSIFEVTPALVPGKDVLVRKLITLVDQQQECVLWLPLYKSTSQSD